MKCMTMENVFYTSLMLVGCKKKISIVSTAKGAERQEESPYGAWEVPKTDDFIGIGLGY